MQTIIFEPGKFYPKVDSLVNGEGMIASATRYHTSSFNRRKNAHLSFVLSGGCAERKKYAYERFWV
jgi:hypothetical protein